MNFRDNNYILAREINKRFNNSIPIGEYHFQYNDMETTFYMEESKQIIVCGFIVDSHAERKTRNEIVAYLWSSKDVDELIERSKRFAGRFVIIYLNGDEFIFLPDATSSIPVSYTVPEFELVVSSNPKIIADFIGFEESITAREIKSQATEIHPLPYDLSMYEQVKYVIPNHYLDCSTQRANRYFPKGEIATRDVDDVVMASVELLVNISTGYLEKRQLSIPLTAGIDSRTVLAIFKKHIDAIPLYTFQHDGFNDTTPDIAIPKQIAEQYKLDYRCIRTLDVPEDIAMNYRLELGSSYNSYIAKNAYTYSKTDIAKRTFLSGDIIPLVKSNFGKKAPEFLATGWFLVTKTHNYSKRNKLEVDRWVEDVKLNTKKSIISKYDLFFWEHRIGKWVANNLMNYDLLTESLNVFNCREIIEMWLSVPRNKRFEESIHKKIIQILWPGLLEFPINPNKKYQFINDNTWLSYLASIVKHYLRIPG